MTNRLYIALSLACAAIVLSVLLGGKWHANAHDQLGTILSGFEVHTIELRLPDTPLPTKTHAV